MSLFDRVFPTSYALIETSMDSRWARDRQDVLKQMHDLYGKLPTAKRLVKLAAIFKGSSVDPAEVEKLLSQRNTEVAEARAEVAEMFAAIEKKVKQADPAASASYSTSAHGKAVAGQGFFGGVKVIIERPMGGTWRVTTEGTRTVQWGSRAGRRPFSKAESKWSKRTPAAVATRMVKLKAFWAKEDQKKADLHNKLKGLKQ